ncbi:hypothetical protein AALO_G00304670, partial [Alosa alosa]
MPLLLCRLSSCSFWKNSVCVCVYVDGHGPLLRACVCVCVCLLGGGVGCYSLVCVLLCPFCVLCGHCCECLCSSLATPIKGNMFQPTHWSPRIPYALPLPPHLYLSFLTHCPLPPHLYLSFLT